MPNPSHRSLRATVIFASLALALEGLAVWALCVGQPESSLFAHAAASLFTALAALFVSVRRTWLGPPLAAGGLAISMPGVGVLGLILVVLPAWLRRRGLHDDGVLELALPTFGADVEPETGLRAGAPVESVLRNATKVSERVNAVMALRRMDAQRAVPLLRTALLDESEDVRLLAYAILERREKQLRASIERALVQLEHARNKAFGEGELGALRDLAYGHWELVRGGFLSDEVAKQTLLSAMGYAKAALAQQTDAALIVLLARMQLRRGDPLAALRCLEHAEAHGVSRAVSAPLSAEAAFLLRRFDAIPRLLARAESAQLQRPQLDAVVDFWTRGGEP